MSLGPLKNPIQAILFDLDGTLIDSAPDLGAAADQMRVVRGLPSLPWQITVLLQGQVQEECYVLPLVCTRKMSNFPSCVKSSFRTTNAV